MDCFPRAEFEWEESREVGEEEVYLSEGGTAWIHAIR